MVRIELSEGLDRRHLEAIIERFERACRAGTWPRIEDALPEGTGRRAVLIELVHVELELLLKAGHPAEAADYLERFPELASDPSFVRGLVALEGELRGRSTRPPAVPDRLGRFELIEEIGHGATSVVYRAIDTTLGRVVALKVLTRGGSPRKGDQAARFFREARCVSRLRHPGIVPLYEVGQSDGFCYLVSELIDGPTLAAQIADDQPGPHRAAELVAAVAEALEHSHRSGVLHRDLKPSNILIDADGRPLLADFGLARRIGGEASLTGDGEILGTPCYMSPEQARGDGRRVNQRSDIYSLGVILYELLTGEVPYRGSPRMVLAQVIDGDPRPPRRLVETVPRDLETVCLKAMDTEPARRYPTAAAMAEDLRRFLDGRPVLARPIGPAGLLLRRARRHPIATGLLLALWLSLAAGGLGVSWQWSRAEDHLNAARLQAEETQRLHDRAQLAINGLADLLRALTDSPDEVIHKQASELLTALTYAERAGRELGQDDKLLVSLARLYAHTAGITLRDEHHALSCELLREAIARFEQLAIAQPDSDDVVNNLSLCSLYLARMERDSGRPEVALDVFRQSLAWTEAQIQAGNRRRSTLNRQVMTILELGKLLRQMKRHEDAIVALRRAADLGEEYRHPERLRMLVCQAESTYLLASSLFDLERDAEALPLFQQSAELYEELTLRQPDRPSWRRQLAFSLDNIGNILNDTGRPDESLEPYLRAEAILENLASEQPDVSDLASDLAATRRSLAEALDDLNVLTESGCTTELSEASRNPSRSPTIR